MENYLPLICTHKDMILDTDIGPDCDDAGALCILYHYAKAAGFRVLATINCTSNPYGNGALDAINRFCGFPETQLGQYGGEGFLCGEETLRFNKYLSMNFSEAYKNGSLLVSPSIALYRRLLHSAKDGGLVLVTIGQFNTVAEALRDDPALFNRKVSHIISMAAKFPEGREYNVFCDPSSAKYVFDNYNGSIICSGFEVGENVYTGFADAENCDTNPIKCAYRLYNDGNLLRNSWDLTAVHFACTADPEHYGVSAPGRLEIAPDGSNRFIPDDGGNCAFITRNSSDEALASYLNSILAG